MQVFAFLTVMLLQLQTIAVWQVYRLLRQRSQSQRRGLLLQEFPVCQKTFCSLLGVGKKRFERLRQAAVKEEPCPVDERFRPKHHEFLAPGSMRPTVYEWLEKMYLTTAEPLPEAYNVDAAASPPNLVRRRGKRPRHFMKVDPDARREKGHSEGAKFLPPGTIGEYLELCRADHPGAKIGRKLFTRAPQSDSMNFGLVDLPFDWISGCCQYGVVWMFIG